MVRALQHLVLLDQTVPARARHGLAGVGGDLHHPAHRPGIGHSGSLGVIGLGRFRLGLGRLGGDILLGCIAAGQLRRTVLALRGGKAGVAGALELLAARVGGACL
jgi:hypothetical protein